MTERCPECGHEIDDGFIEYRCPDCGVLIVTRTQENMDKAIKNHKCKLKKAGRG
jgi:predicted RNA-binding Zn-ribbon protein involved in translation (DUF1610 family)